MSFQPASIENVHRSDDAAGLRTEPERQKRPRTLVEALEALPATADRGFRFRALDGTERFFQWRDLVREAGRRGGLLLDAGLSKGDRLVIVIPEPHELVLTLLGAIMVGIVPVPVYPPTGFKAKGAYIETIAHIVQAEARARS